MIRKFYKGSEIKIYNPDTELEGHIFALGRIGGGKSVSTLSIIQGYHDNKEYKIFDIFGGERNEGLYWAIPNQDKEFWDSMGTLGNFDEEGPKQYKVNLLYPMFRSSIHKKLPILKGFVNSIVFTIPLKDVTTDDIRMVMGNLSDTSKYIWDEVVHLAKKTDNAGALPYLAKKVKGNNSSVYKQFILPMYREGFLMDENCEHNLDLKKEAKDKDTITVLCLDFIKERYHLFIINYLIKKLVELIDLNKIPKKNILFIREAATFFKATEDSVLEDRFKIFRTYMSHYIRMGRRGTYFALDCQSSFEVRGLVQGSEDYLLMFKTTSWRDKEEMCNELKREKRMRNDQIADLAFLEKGECYIAETGKVIRKVKISLPRTMFWKKEYGNFYKNVWEKFGGNWVSSGYIVDDIEQRIDAIKQKYAQEEKEKEEKSTKQEKKELIPPAIEIKEIPKPEINIDNDWFPLPV